YPSRGALGKRWWDFGVLRRRSRCAGLASGGHLVAGRPYRGRLRRGGPGQRGRPDRDPHGRPARAGRLARRGGVGARGLLPQGVSVSTPAWLDRRMTIACTVYTRVSAGTD